MAQNAAAGLRPAMRTSVKPNAGSKAGIQSKSGVIYGVFLVKIFAAWLFLIYELPDLLGEDGGSLMMFGCILLFLDYLDLSKKNRYAYKSKWILIASTSVDQPESLFFDHHILNGMVTWRFFPNSLI